MPTIARAEGVVLPEAWTKLAQKETKMDPQKLVWNSPEGIAVKPVYTAEDTQALALKGDLPGVFPYTRGPRATMYTHRPWTVPIAPRDGVQQC